MKRGDCRLSAALWNGLRCALYTFTDPALDSGSPSHCINDPLLPALALNLGFGN